MADRLRVDHVFQHNWRDFLILVTALFAGAAVSFSLVGWWDWARLAGLGLLGSFIPLGIEVAAGRRRWRAVTVTGDGFVLHDRRGDRTFRDEQVLCVSLLRVSQHRQDKIHESPKLAAVVRTLAVWVETPQGCERIPMVNLIDADHADPLQEFIDRMQGRLLDEAQQALASGGTCAGEGWTLGRNDLTVDAGGTAESQQVPLRELAAAAIIDHAFCIWRRGQDDPLIRVPLESANAAVLVELLGDSLPERPPDNGEPESGVLGRLLFERRRRFERKDQIEMLATCCAGFVGCWIAAVLPGKMSLASAVMGTLAAAAIWSGYRLLVSSGLILRCYEHGVWSRRFLCEERLAYSDVEQFRFSAMDLFVKGVYVHTRYVLEFVPRAATGRRTIRHAVRALHDDHALEQVRVHVSRAIAARMIQELQAGQPVTWTSRLRFHPEGLEATPPKGLFRGAAQLIPYDEVDGTELRDGWFYLWRSGVEAPAASERSGERNFFPGQIVLDQCLRAARSEHESVLEVARFELASLEA